MAKFVAYIHQANIATTKRVQNPRATGVSNLVRYNFLYISKPPQKKNRTVARTNGPTVWVMMVTALRNIAKQVKLIDLRSFALNMMYRIIGIKVMARVIGRGEIPCSTLIVAVSSNNTASRPTLGFKNILPSRKMKSKLTTSEKVRDESTASIQSKPISWQIKPHLR